MKVLTQNLWLINSLAIRKAPPPHKQERTEGFMQKLKEEGCTVKITDDESQSEKTLPKNNNGKEKRKTPTRPVPKQFICPEFDFVCLQEVFRFGNVWMEMFSNSYHSTLVKKALKLNYHVAISDDPSPMCQDSGLVILSKFPIMTCKNYVFQNASWNDYVTAKGILFTKVRHPQEGIIFLFTLHMDAHDTEVRRGQLDELTTFVRECTMPSFLKNKHEKQSIVIAGDFNICSRSDPFYEEIMGKLNERVCSQYHEKYEFRDVLGDRSTHPETHKDECLDRVLVTVPKQTNDDKLSYKLIEWKTKLENGSEILVSDHLGILAEFDLSKI